jgi:hypothetical protein
MYTCVSNSCHRGEMAWICCKAHTSDEGAHCTWDMTLSHVTKVVKIKTRLGLMDQLQVWRASWVMTWHRWTNAMVKTKWSQDRWTNMVTWCGSYHLWCGWCMCCINIRGDGMECERQRYIYRAFHFTSHRCVEKFMTGFRIDGRTINRGKLVCISVI